MAAPLVLKRMAKERQDLEKASFQDKGQDYFVIFQDDNLLQFDAYVIAPDTIYRYRLVKLQLDMPAEYPLQPPKLKFIQHTGDRIHPNLYVQGKAYGMTCHTALITIRSLLDDEPYKHEPHGSNNPTFNHYVEYATWKSLLLDYLAKETNPAAKAWLDSYVHKNGEAMLLELSRLHQAAKTNRLRSLRLVYRSQKIVPVDYPALINTLQTAISEAAARQGLSPAHNSSHAPMKRKAGASEIGDEEEAEKKRAKPSVATKPQSHQEIIDLT